MNTYRYPEYWEILSYSSFSTFDGWEDVGNQNASDAENNSDVSTRGTGSPTSSHPSSALKIRKHDD